MARDVARVERTATMRAADSDRQQIADRLRSALDEGRLTLAEFDDRVGQAYAARTYADLLHLVDDLPEPGLKADDVRAQTAAAARRAARRLPTALLVLWTIWAALGAVNVAVWLLVSMTNSDVYPWPVWVVIPPGAALLTVSVGTQMIRRRQRRRHHTVYY
jgi:hypothetical protein